MQRSTYAEETVDRAQAGDIKLFKVVDAALLLTGDDHQRSLRGLFEFFNGSFLESFDALATSDGVTITMTLEKAGGGNLIMVFSDGLSMLKTTPPLTIALTPGNDAAPQDNYIYILKTGKTLVKNLTDWPAEEHIRVGYFFVPSAVFVNTPNRGLYVNQNHNDESFDGVGQGHMTHLSERSRRQPAIWRSGVAGGGTTGYLTITTNLGIPDNVTVQTTAGVLYQMHRHNFPAHDTSATAVVLVVNDFVTKFNPVADLNTLLTDALGVSMVGKYFNLVLGGVINKGGEFSPLFLNVPTGSYNKLSDALSDISGHDVFAMPGAFLQESSTGFLIARLTVRHQPASGGTWTLEATIDLRGQLPSVASGGASVPAVEFPDNLWKLFDETDVTKLMSFQLSGITTGTERVLTVPDLNGVIFTDQGGTMNGNIDLANGVDILPVVDVTSDLGDSTHRFGNGFFRSLRSDGGSVVILDNGTGSGALLQILADDGGPWLVAVQNETYDPDVTKGLRMLVTNVGEGRIYAPDDGATPGNLAFYLDEILRLTIRSDGALVFTEAMNNIYGTVTGTKHGTTALQKQSWWGAGAIVQPAHIADADGTLPDITTKFNALLAQMAATGLQAAV